MNKLSKWWFLVVIAIPFFLMFCLHIGIALGTFPYIVPQIGADHKENRFAIIIDEAHSGQSGRNSAQMNLALS